jgi:hypothetical protein
LKNLGIRVTSPFVVILEISTQNPTSQFHHIMKRSTRLLITTAAAAGLCAGAFAARSYAESQVSAASSTLTVKDTAKHDCKGKNACKSQGNCKAGDNGCAGKNSCKGKGGCASKPGA